MAKMPNSLTSKPAQNAPSGGPQPTHYVYRLSQYSERYRYSKRPIGLYQFKNDAKLEQSIATAESQRHNKVYRTQPCIPPGSLNRVPASAVVRAGISPLSGGR